MVVAKCQPPVLKNEATIHMPKTAVPSIPIQSEMPHFTAEINMFTAWPNSLDNFPTITTVEWVND